MLAVIALLMHALTVAAEENPAAVAFWSMVVVGLAMVLGYLLLRDAIRALGPVLHTYAETRRAPRRRAARERSAKPAPGYVGSGAANGVAPAAVRELRR